MTTTIDDSIGQRLGRRLHAARLVVHRPGDRQAGAGARVRRTWQYAGPAELVAEPGSYLATRVGHAPVVIVRDEDGELRGFVNVCRHRAHLVATGHGKRKALQCPYHAWTYGLDGCLRKAPRSDREPGFDRSRLLAGAGHGRAARADAVRQPRRDGRGRCRRSCWRRAGALARAGVDLDQLRAAPPRGLHDPGQLEDRPRELPGVLPLSRRPPRAVQARGRHRGRLQAGRGRTGRQPVRRRCATPPSPAPR